MDSEGGLRISARMSWMMNFICFAFITILIDPVVSENIGEGSLETIYETLMTFECKMSLQYVPNFNRYVFDDSSSKYFTSCEFENYMWHHVYVSINETGYGFLMVDGLRQELVTVDNELDLATATFVDLGRDFFETDMHPSKCVANPSARRSLLSMEDKFSANKNSEQPVADGYPEEQVMEPLDGSWRTSQDCCNFRVAERCRASDVKPYYGFVDEVAVYNRALDEDEIRATMWAMPQHLHQHELEAPRGVQMDYTAGRVLYVRFNKPCSEKAMPTPSPPPPPSPTLSEGQVAGQVVRKLLWDDRAAVVAGSARRLLDDRLLNLSDSAGLTAGYTTEAEALSVTDDFDDRVTLNDYPNNCKYVYSGVPWAQPHVGEIKYEFSSDAAAVEALPMDGDVEVTVHGVGFSNSPFTRCVVVPPDAGRAQESAPRSERSRSEYNYFYEWNDPDRPTMLSTTESMNAHARSDRILWTEARPVFAEWPNSPRLNLNFAVDMADEWNQTVVYTNQGEIPPFLADPNGIYDDFIVGYWQTLRCKVPKVAFPSDKFQFGVSNDGTRSSSPLNSVTMMNYALDFTQGGELEMGSALLQDMGETFTMSFWVFMAGPPRVTQTVVELTTADQAVGKTGLYWEGLGVGQLSLYLNGEYQAENAEKRLLPVGMWHFVALSSSNDGGGKMNVWMNDERVISQIDFVTFVDNQDTIFSRAVQSMTMGKDFNGYIDQLKIWQEPTENDDVLYGSRFESATEGTLAYFRFGMSLSSEAVPGADTIYNMSETLAGWSFSPTSAPWEPSSTYTINGEAVSSADIAEQLIKAPVTGGDSVDLVGFNFAPSMFLKCRWGRRVASPGAAYDTSISKEYACLDKDGPLGRHFPNNENITLTSLEVYEIDEARYTTAVDGLGDHTRVRCDTPYAPDGGFINFAAANKAALNVFSFELQDVSLMCDGETTAILAPEVVTRLAGAAAGYTVSVWVMPAAPSASGVPEASPGAEEGAGAGAGATRKLLAKRATHAKRRSSRRAVLEGEMPHPETVLAFETQEGGNIALIMYDGLRFFYYDDYIMDVPTIPQATEEGMRFSAPGEWHLVTVSVNADGQGYLYVDDDQHEHFTTTSSPTRGVQAPSLFTICADHVGSEAGSHFHGMVDRVAVYASAYPIEDQATHHVVAIEGGDRDPSTLVALFVFDGNLTFDLASASSGTGERVTYQASAVPWAPATVLGVRPVMGSASGDTELEVTGANFARSRWLSFKIGEQQVPFRYPAGDDSLNRVTVTTSRLEDSCLDELPVTGSNARFLLGSPEESLSPLSPMYAYQPTPTDYAKGLRLRLSFQAVEMRASPSGEAHAVFKNHADVDGEYELQYPAVLQTKDRHEVARAAVMIDTQMEGAQVTFPALKTMQDGNVTVCVSMFLEEGLGREIERVFPGFLQLGGATMLGGWKMACVVYSKFPDMQDDTGFREEFDMFVNGVHMVNDTQTSIFGLVYMPIVETMYEFGVLGGLNGAVENAQPYSGMVDEVLFYERPLKPCEVLSLFYTDAYALDVTLAQGPPETRSPVVLQVPAGLMVSHNITVSMWVHPYSTEGFQTLVTSQLDGLGMDIGLYGESLSFGVFVKSDCECGNCASGTAAATSRYAQHESWRSKVFPNQWTHVAVTYIPQSGSSTLVFYVDGVMLDMAAIDGPDAVFLEPEPKLYLAPDFDGKIFDLKVSTPLVHHYFVKNDTQCAPAAFDEHQMYVSFQSSADEKVFSRGQVAVVEGVRAMMVNASYDDPTYPLYLDMYGDDMLMMEVGDVGMFTLTSRTACGRKRKLGGDPWNLTMFKDDSSGVVIMPTITDTNDGNYHFLFTPTTSCGAYTTVLTFDNEEVSTWTSMISPKPTDAPSTYIVGGVPTSATFGVTTVLTIQTMDDFQCKTAFPQEDTDKLKVVVDGPYHVPVDIAMVPNSQGLYTVALVFEAFGQYRFNITYDGRPIKADEAVFCLDVSSGGSLEVSAASGGVTVEEAALGLTALDMHSHDGMTVEIWVSFDSLDEVAYPVFKGSADQIGAFVKGYQMKVSPGFELYGEVYTSRGDLRSASVNLTGVSADASWHHLAMTYNGTLLSLFLDGQMLANSSYQETKPLNPNMYMHPLTIGYGMAGRVDEVKMWHVARSAEDIMETMYCPPYKQLPLVAAYFAFNEAQGSTTYGHGSECGLDPMMRANGAVTCLMGSFGDGAALLAGVTPLALATATGVGYASGRQSEALGVPLHVMAGQSEVAFTVVARDRCGYCYLGGSPDAVTSELTKYSVQYLTSAAPGTEYPQLVEDTQLAAVQARPSAGFCPLWGARDEESPGALGDVFDVRLSNAAISGTYFAAVLVQGEPVSAHPYRMEVTAATPTSFRKYEAAESARDPVAGLPFVYYVQVMDALENVVRTKIDFSGQVSILGQTYQMVYALGENDIAFDESDAVYTITVTLGINGTYLLALNGDEGMVPYTDQVICTVAPWQKLITSAEAPAVLRRFEHTMTESDGDLYVFGGASYDKTYLNDVWKLEDTDHPALRYQSDIPLNYPPDVPEGAKTVTVTLNTAVLIQQGWLNRFCMDLAWTSMNLEFYMDPYPGCNQDETVFYVRLPEDFDEESLMLFHGGMPNMHENMAHNPQAVFAYYEGFEVDAHQPISLRPGTACDSDELSMNFALQEMLPYAGKKGLYMRHSERGALQYDFSEPMSTFRLRAWLWDSASVAGAHVLSPNYQMCRTPEGSDVTLIGDAVAVGIFTLSDETNYCVGQPWNSTGLARTNEWHRLEIFSDQGMGARIVIDGVTVKTMDDEVHMDKVLLSSGLGVREREFEGLDNSHAFWDEISVLVPSGVTADTSGMSPVPVFSKGRKWDKIDTGAVNPPPRYSHTTVKYQGSMYVFGGERSAYSFNDMWRFDLDQETWAPVTLSTNDVPPARFDHSATIMDHPNEPGEMVMVIYGGRSGHIFLGDMWMYSFLNSTWTQLATSMELSPGLRFGHAAATAANGRMYIFGGYTETGFSSDFLVCDLNVLDCRDITSGCPDVATSNSVPSDLAPRYSHSMVAKEDMLYVYGGSNLNSVEGFPHLYKFATNECFWEKLVPISTNPSPVGRYEHAVAMFQDSFLVVHGGHDNGTISSDTYLYPL